MQSLVIRMMSLPRSIVYSIACVFSFASCMFFSVYDGTTYTLLWDFPHSSFSFLYGKFLDRIWIFPLSWISPIFLTIHSILCYWIKHTCGSRSHNTSDCWIYTRVCFNTVLLIEHLQTPNEEHIWDDIAINITHHLWKYAFYRNISVNWEKYILSLVFISYSIACIFIDSSIISTIIGDQPYGLCTIVTQNHLLNFSQGSMYVWILESN